MLVIFMVYKEHYVGVISVGTFIAFNSAFLQFMAAQTQITIIGPQLLQSIIYHHRACPILAEEKEIEQFDTKSIVQINGAIHVDHVSLRYDDQNKDLLSHLSLSIEPGQFIAVTGEGGCGKSSFIKLLLGLLKPTQGNVYIDHRSIEDYDLPSLRASFGVALQTSKFFTGSLFQNLDVNRGLSEDDIYAALRLVGMEEAVLNLPMRLSTHVSDEFSPFSGGQRQMLLLARALMGNPKILLLDEPTSALDNRSQQRVVDSIAGLNATKIFVTQRFATIRKADHVIVLGNGTIVEQGSYAALMEAKGYFYRLSQRGGSS